MQCRLRLVNLIGPALIGPAIMNYPAVQVFATMVSISWLGVRVSLAYILHFFCLS